MAKQHKFQTNFAAGVVSENAFGRIDTELYNNGLKKGDNIIIENPGGMARRPGTLFVYEFEHDYVTLIPFSFNTEQTYLLAFSPLKIEIFLNDPDEIPILQATLATPYIEDQIKEFDYAQSADSMVITHTTHPVQVLRRLGSDVSWEFVPVIFTNPPQELICADGDKPLQDGTCFDASTPVEENVWGELNGYPKYCTFFQGRLYFAAARLLPQHVWGSVTYDFFNFQVGTEDSSSIHDILDTDFINPITAIYAEKRLFVFSTGDEFVNGAEVITPATSSWQRVSKNGSFGTIRPVTLDGGVLYLDRSGRTIRTLRFNDSIKAFDSQSVSLYSEHLIVAPTDMGIMKGSLFQASNFLFLVNSDGTIAVLNLSQATNMSAWTLWRTQGAFKEVITFNNELTYVLVERRGKWILEKLQDGVYIDSGSLIETDTQVKIKDIITYEDENVTYLGIDVTHGFISVDAGDAGTIGDKQNYFGISYDTRGYGRTVIVINGEEIYKNIQFVREPKVQISQLDSIYLAVDKFLEDSEIEDEHFSSVAQTEFYLYTMIVTEEFNAQQNFIDGLPHLIGRDVVMNLDGSVFDDEIVVPGDLLPGGGLIKDYPNGEAWAFDETPGNETFIARYLTPDIVTNLIEGYYLGDFHSPLTLNSFWNAYPITNFVDEPVVGDEFLEQGPLVQSVLTGDVTINYNSTTGNNQDSVTGSNGTFTFTNPFPYEIPIKICMVGGGGSGAYDTRTGNNNFGGGGYAGKIVSKTINVAAYSTHNIVIGLGGLAVTSVNGGYSNGNAGQESTFNAETAAGGDSGKGASSLYAGNGASKPQNCAGFFKDGTKYAANTHTGQGGEGALGNGGRGGSNGFGVHEATDGTAGSGGGGYSWISSGGGHTTGKGGDGRCIISWQYTSRKYQTRKMVLTAAAVPQTDGVIPVQRAFIRGQAGLWFGVDVETLPFNGGTLTNEPKRIVSVMARFVNTAGLNIANNKLPERDFGEEVLDAPPPQKSGIQKIRLFGYTRETTLRITQNDPLPMTLTNLDIEINI